MVISDNFRIFATIEKKKVMDKVIYLIDRDAYRKEVVEHLTQKDLEEWVADEGYTEDFTIMKIDCTFYGSIIEALRNEMDYALNEVEDENILAEIQEKYYFFAFGF